MTTFQTTKNRKCDYLSAGSFKIQDNDTFLIATVTEGVCICLWNSIEKKGGVCHLNPSPTGEGREQGENLIFRFFRSMVSECQIGQFTAAVIGGAHTEKDSERGEENLKLAHEYLDLQDILVVLNEERGTRPRKVSMDTLDGTIKTITL